MRGNRRSQLKSSPDEPMINITPLIDVVFVVLIAFIVIAPLLELDRIRLAGGDRAPSHIPIRVESASSIQIHVQADDSLLLNGQLLPMTELARCLIKEKATHPQARVQLFHDKDARFGTYQRVKNSLELSGFEEMDVVLNP